ncbi:ArnT family glycosyltransferase [Paenibacillus elgii]|uniref:ArnT family glycosyltransferase n=1 Tax=Paenibacillus elgii TaxID=189691 RepID=UPI000FD7C4FF|nr:glycosyltransferase family 39 protein [Paenibacillus elgii]NEN84298.1 glycosyltransferase family 39 protein [Paenibacillus elgii]
MKRKTLTILVVSIIYSLLIYFSNDFSKFSTSTLNLNMKVEGGEKVSISYGNENNAMNAQQNVKYKENTEMNHHIEITNLFERDANSKGSELWIFSIKADNELVNWDKIKTVGNWELREDSRGQQNKTLLSYMNERETKLILDVKYKEKLEIDFLKHDYSGKVQLKIDNKVDIINLYSPNQTSYLFKIQNHEPDFYNYKFNLSAQEIDKISLIPNNDQNVVVKDAFIESGNNIIKIDNSGNNVFQFNKDYNKRNKTDIILQCIVRVIITFLFITLLIKIYENFSKNRKKYNFLFYLILGLGFLVRIILVVDFPHGFFFNDSAGYMETASSLAKEMSLQTNLDRTPGYGVFIYLISVIFPYKSFFLVIVQHLLGIYISILVYNILNSHINKYFSLIGFILIIFSPHLIIYEHTVLTDVLFTFILLLFVYHLNSTILSSKRLSIKRVFSWGIFVAILVMVRPAGYYLIPIVFVLIFLLGKFNKDTLKIIAKRCIMYCLPIIVVVLSWNLWNYSKYNYFGTTAINGLGLVLVAGNLIDVESTSTFTQSKEVVKNAVFKTNQQYNGELIDLAKFLGWDPNGVRIKLINSLPLKMNEGEKDQLLFALTKEGVLNHPLNYAYHFLHEFKKIYFHDMSYKYYSDIRGYLNYDSNNQEKRLMSKEDIFKNSIIRSDADYFGYKNTSSNIMFNSIIPFLPSTFNIGIFTIICMISLSYVPFSSLKYHTKVSIFIFASINIAHIIFNSLTNFAVDRYMLPVLPYLIIIGVIGLSSIITSLGSLNEKSKRYEVLRWLIFSFLLTCWIFVYKNYIFVKNLNWKIDNPVYGLSKEWFEYHQNYAIHSILLAISTILLAVILFLLVRKKE